MTKDRARIKAAQFTAWADAREAKIKLAEENFSRTFGSFDWTEPIKIGHHSERRHRKVFERRDNHFRSIIESEKIVKRMREKAENLLSFANRNKGDAERKREVKRAVVISGIKNGSRVTSPFFWGKEFDVVKLNLKTAKIKCGEFETVMKIDFLELATG